MTDVLVWYMYIICSFMRVGLFASDILSGCTVERTLDTRINKHACTGLGRMLSVPVYMPSCATTSSSSAGVPKWSYNGHHLVRILQEYTTTVMMHRDRNLRWVTIIYIKIHILRSFWDFGTRPHESILSYFYNIKYVWLNQLDIVWLFRNTRANHTKLMVPNLTYHETQCINPPLQFSTFHI